VTRTALGLLSLALVTLALFVSAAGAPSAARPAFWVDLYAGEPLTWGELLEDLVTVRVLYVGELHRLERHHDVQARLMEELAARGASLAVGLEMLERGDQAALSRYARGEIGFDELAEETDWAETWSNYAMYRGVLEAAREAGAPLRALNVERALVRRVAQVGLDGLEDEERAALPDELDTKQPMYARHVRSILGAHAAAMGGEAAVQRMFEAQVARDETMAEAAASFLASERGEGRLMVVIAGSGHVAHALGIPSRVRRRLPDLDDRILVLSSSGDQELTEKERAMAEAAAMSHAELRHLSVPLADYLHVRPPR
jgi:uncharacterized iron-regulated protein